MRAKALLLVLLIAVISLVSCAYAVDQSDYVTKEDWLKYDFNYLGSPTMTGYTACEYNYAFDGTLGWSYTGGIDGRDRGSGTNLNRDFAMITAPSTGTFDRLADDGSYNVTIYTGDMSYSHVGMCFDIEGVEVADKISTATGEVKALTFNVNVTDGYITIRMRNELGANTTNCNGLDIDKIVFDEEAYQNAYLAENNNYIYVFALLGCGFVFFMVMVFWRRRN